MSLEDLLEKARHVKMTPEQWEEQRISFAYGNAKIENDRITREMVRERADLLKKEQADLLREDS